MGDSASPQEKVDAARQFSRLDRQFGQASAVRPPAFDGVGHRTPPRLVPAVGVEQVALPALVEQPLLIVLAVDLDERPDLLGQSRSGRGQVVESGGGAAAGRHLSDRDQRLGKSVEEGLDPRSVRPVADESRIGPRAADQPERIDQQALAGTGLAGDDVQAGLERQAQAVDEREVAHGQLEETPRGHDGSNATLCRSRSQNGWAPSGSMSRIGRSTARTSTTSPTLAGMSSRPSTDTSTS